MLVIVGDQLPPANELYNIDCIPTRQSNIRWDSIAPHARVMPKVRCRQLVYVWRATDNHRNNIMMTSSDGNIFRVTGQLCGEFTGPRWIPRTKASDAELWCFLWWINGWVNNGEAGDLRRLRAHYDVIVMLSCGRCYQSQVRQLLPGSSPECAKLSVIAFQSHLYLACVIAAERHSHLSNMKVRFIGEHRSDI